MAVCVNHEIGAFLTARAPINHFVDGLQLEFIGEQPRLDFVLLGEADGWRGEFRACVAFVIRVNDIG